MTSTKRPLLLGHRGARQPQVAENTIAAFELALGAGCDGFEFDVRCTRDRQLVVVHDPRLRGLEVAESTYAELRERANEELPVLANILQRYGGRAFLDLELKVAGMRDLVLKDLRAHAPQRGFVVSSFLPQALREIQDAEIPLGLICENARQLAAWRELPLQYVIPHYRLATTRLVEELHAAGKKVLVWTVNGEADARRATEWGVDGIITDDPERMARAVAGDDKFEN